MNSRRPWLNVVIGRRSVLPDGTERLKTANVYAHTRTKNFGAEVKRRLLLGTHALSAE
jgi:aspartyl-tRNA(Asn)/glutamyl-tRNA(Gln) amidotransferase subunit A